VVAHEPPLPRVLPDPGEYLADYDEIDRVLAAEGWQAAFRLFHARIGRVPPDRLPETMTVLLDPARALPPGPQLDLMTRVSRNWPYMMTYEVRPFIDYTPDFELLTGNRARIVLAAGIESAEPGRHICTVSAGQLDAEFAGFPGGHTAPMEFPDAFAVRLRPLLKRPWASGQWPGTAQA
jgi:hypothetical protein